MFTAQSEDREEEEDPVRRRTFVGLTGTSLFGAILADTARGRPADAIESFAAVLASYASDTAGPALDAPPTNPELYTVGCAGRIERCEPQPDGRYLILLKGVSRFRVRRELALRHGYRRVAADYSEFAADLGEPAVALDPAPVLRALRAFGQQQGLSFDFDVLAALTGVALLNGLAVALPFPPAEKQLLLEAEGPHQRQQLLLTLMGMGVEPPGSGDYYAPPVVH